MQNSPVSTTSARAPCRTTTPPAQPPPFFSEIAEGYGYYSDSDLEDDIDHHGAHSVEQFENAVSPNDPPLGHSSSSTVDDKSLPTYGERRERNQQGKAFLLFLYTGHTKFAPYGSAENRRSRAADICAIAEDEIPLPSPKSIYRLADKYDVPALKKLAWDSITDGINQCDIVEEAFSEFTSRYEEVRNAQIGHLAHLWFRGNEESARNIGERVDEMIESYAHGKLDHAMEAVTLLWERSRDFSPDCRLPCNPGLDDVPVPQVTTIFPRLLSKLQDWRPLKMALIKSIREGAFFDREYWVRNPKSAGALRPIYISSIVAGETLRRINSLVNLHRTGKHLDTEDGSEDSDSEDGPEHAGVPTPEAQTDRREKVEQENFPALTIGSFMSWRSLLFYLNTSTIEFAPLKSQGADLRARYAREQTGPDRPPPCSPKLEIESLRDLAFEDIRSKITSENVTTELFSGFTSRESNVMRMHCELLGSRFSEETITTSVSDLIKNMVGGKAAYRAGALTLALRNGRYTTPVRAPSLVVSSPWHEVEDCGINVDLVFV